MTSLFVFLPLISRNKATLELVYNCTFLINTSLNTNFTWH
jgi:hypothetical protein